MDLTAVYCVSFSTWKLEGKHFLNERVERRSSINILQVLGVLKSSKGWTVDQTLLLGKPNSMSKAQGCHILSLSTKVMCVGFSLSLMEGVSWKTWPSCSPFRTYLSLFASVVATLQSNHLFLCWYFTPFEVSINLKVISFHYKSNLMKYFEIASLN